MFVSEETCFCNAVPHKQCSSSYDLPNNIVCLVILNDENASNPGGGGGVLTV